MECKHNTTNSMSEYCLDAWTNELVNQTENCFPQDVDAIGELYESFVHKRALVKYQSQSELIKMLLYISQF